MSRLLVVAESEAGFPRLFKATTHMKRRFDGKKGGADRTIQCKAIYTNVISKTKSMTSGGHVVLIIVFYQ